MLQRDKVQKQKHTSANEYVQAEANMITTSSHIKQEQSDMETYEFMVDYKKEEVKVTIEVPSVSDKQAEQELFGRLKQIYLEKIKNLSMQEKESALHCQSNERQEGTKDE